MASWVNDEGAATAIRALYEEWLGGAVARGRTFYEEVLAEDWLYTDTTGNRRTKARYINDVLSLAGADYAGSVTELEARRLGEAVLVLGRYHAVGRFGEHEVDGDTTFTSLWVEGGAGAGWTCLAHHSTDVLPPQW